MNTQATLFSPDIPRLPAQMHSETSKAAAKRERRRQNAFKWEVLKEFTANWICTFGLTDNELYALFPKAKQGTLRARRIDLTGIRKKKQVGPVYLKDSGNKRKGCAAWIWTGLEGPG